jgi:hypothetical protein
VEGAGVARVVAVHGIGKAYSAAPVMASEWVPALVGGAELAGGRGALRTEDMECVFYGDVFRRPGRLLGDADLESLTVDDVDERDAEVLAAWWAEAAEVDARVIPPGARSLGVASGVQAALAALAGSRFLAGATERLLILWLRQVRAYFTQPQVRAVAQQRLGEAIRADTRVVVAHSLGSVLAYEVLCAHPEWPVRTLVTLGSPLGIRTIIFDRLTPPPSQVGQTRRGAWPGGVVSWTNIADRLDFVALVKALGPAFGEAIVDVEITNGVRMHDVSRYLTAVETGQAILAGCTDDRPNDG